MGKPEQHTPGPWKAHKNVIRSGKVEIAFTALDVPGAKANARLIAAAPELLATLEDVLSKEVFDLVVNGHLMDDATKAATQKSLLENLPALYEQVRLAIAKARGV